MSNLPQEQFNQLLTTYGNQLCEEPQRCEALLRDTFPGNPREVSLLVNALKQGIPQELLASQGKVPFEVSRSRLTRKLIDNLFMQDQAAQWVIDAWSAALGIRQAGASPANPIHPPTMMQSPSMGLQDPPANPPTVVRPEVTPPVPQPNYGGNYGQAPSPNPSGPGALDAAYANIAPSSASIPRSGVPSIWTWYIVYCVAMLFLWAFCIFIGYAILAIPSANPDMTEADRLSGAMVWLIFGLIMGLLFLVAPFLPKRPWAWTYHIILICIGMICCCTPFAIPLLIFWVRPENRAFFNMPSY